jgi:hypothetical protein
LRRCGGATRASSVVPNLSRRSSHNRDRSLRQQLAGALHGGSGPHRHGDGRRGSAHRKRGFHVSTGPCRRTWRRHARIPRALFALQDGVRPLRSGTSVPDTPALIQRASTPTCRTSSVSNTSLSSQANRRPPALRRSTPHIILPVLRTTGLCPAPTRMACGTRRRTIGKDVQWRGVDADRQARHPKRGFGRRRKGGALIGESDEPT